MPENHIPKTISEFIDACCVQSPQAWVPRRHLNDAYRKWCQKKGLAPISHIKFHDHIAALPGVGRAVKNKDGASWFSFTGIRLKEE